MALKCIKKKGAAGKVSGKKVRTASKRIDEITAALTAQGVDPFTARAQADAKYMDELTLANTRAKWRMIHKIRVMNGLQKAVDSVRVEDVGGLATKMVLDAHYDARSIHHDMMNQVQDFLKKTKVTILQNVPDKAQFVEIVKALRGEPTSDMEAKALADAVNHVNEWARKMLNSLGYNIGKLENWGITQTHDQLAILKAGLQAWRDELDRWLDWENMIDPKSGMKFGAKPSDEYRMKFLSGVYDNIMYGRDAGKPTYGDSQAGKALEQSRVFKFTTTDDWLAYNSKYGGADPHTAILSHFSVTARRIALAKKFGADAQTSLDYLDQIIAQKYKDAATGAPNDAMATMAKDAARDVQHAKRMEKVLLHGSLAPVGSKAAFYARTFATARKVLSSALLDRAIVISAPSDLNSTRIAAQALDMGAGGIIADWARLMGEAAAGGGSLTDDLLRQGHVFDSWANPGVTMQRYSEDYPAAAWAQKLSNAAMRIQGMNAHTDGLRTLFQRHMAGHFMSLSHLELDALPDIMRKSMKDEGISAAEWDLFRSSGGEFTAANGATFLDPLYWKYATTMQNPDELFLKMQSFVEKWTDLAVPTQSLRVAGLIDPAAYGLTPGTAMYELMKSGGMFKSFPFAFVQNQMKMLELRPNWGSRALYVADLIASTTLVGAMAIQVNDVLMGRDPRPMNDSKFWFNAMFRGGGLGPAGDILASGSTSWGGGLSEYLTGPVVSLAIDASKLTFGNIAQAYSQSINGDDIDVDFMEDFMKMQRKYFPLGQTPLLLGGRFMDATVSERLQIMLDPDSAEALADNEQRRENLHGNGAWWAPGQALPTRAPDLANAMGSQ